MADYKKELSELRELVNQNQKLLKEQQENLKELNEFKSKFSD